MSQSAQESEIWTILMALVTVLVLVLFESSIAVIIVLQLSCHESNMRRTCSIGELKLILEKV